MKEIILNTVKSTSKDFKRLSALVDDDDFGKVSLHKWHLRKSGTTFYAAAKINGKNIRMHKFLTGFSETDHKDGNGLNNQKSNLRECSHSQNMFNQKARKGTSKFKGVAWHKPLNKWRAMIQFNYKNIHIGYFKLEENAAQAYNFMAEKIFGDYARLNKI